MLSTASPLPDADLRLSTRFTLDGSDELEERLGHICEKVLAGVLELVPARRFEGLLLAGGYGRGEGGVLAGENGDEPYNDLEFYVFLKGAPWWSERRFGAELHSLAEGLSLAAGLEVEFKILSLTKLRRSRISMFYYDLVMRHRWLFGQESLLAGCLHHCAPERLPLSEATRLLLNRCSGLLFAAEQLRGERFTPQNADFVGRNLAKAQLAFGDVILTAHGQYHWSCRERGERVKGIKSDFPSLDEVKKHHRAGVEFKLHPQRTSDSRSELANRHQYLAQLGLQLWLWLENRRLNCCFAGPRDYASNPIPKCPETKAWRNYLVNWKAFGLRNVLSIHAMRHPRERVLECLALLLWVPETCIDPKLLSQAQSALGTSATTFHDLVGAYRRLWQQFN